MNIILCEGKTDAILISYFLITVHKYSYSKKEIVKLPIEKNNEEVNWYSKEAHSLAIWAVGGYDRLKQCLAAVIERNESEMRSAYRFDKIILMLDRDTRIDEQLLTDISVWFQESKIRYKAKIKFDNWIECAMTLKKMPTEDYRIDILPLVIPPEGEGALETFLLNSLRDNSDEDKSVINESRQYIQKIQDVSYLKKKRFREKACLGAVLSVFSPDWVFSDINDRICSVRWEEIHKINKGFQNFERL